MANGTDDGTIYSRANDSNHTEQQSDNNGNNIEAAKQQAQTAEELAKEALQQIQQANLPPDSPSTSGKPDITASVNDRPEDVKESPIIDTQEPKAQLDQALQAVQASGQKAQTTVKELHSQAEDAEQKLIKAKEHVEQQEQKLKEKNTTDDGFTIAGYSVSDIAKAFVAPPEPKVTKENSEIQRAKKEMDDTKKTINDARKRIQQTKEQANDFVKKEQTNLNKLSDISKK